MSDYKKTESETLSTFKEEIPSIYYSHKEKANFESYVDNMEYVYRDHFKFPSKMFEDADLIDFGAGTGENTIYLANWGAKCTLVEMNDKAQAISKKVFSDYAIKPEEHSFVNSSIFEYSPTEKKQYDIVHCRGVLSHTSEKEKAFEIISKYVKPGGYIIFGDPNKSGGFQNMLQRYAVYSFASTRDEMVDVCEYLFKEDIDRSENTIPRTRRAIIFDRWVIQQQDDPSLSEVHSWMKENGLETYSSYPGAVMPISSDSVLHHNKYDKYSFENLFSITELIWMMYTEEDSEFIPKIDNNMSDFSVALQELTSYMENFSSNRKVDIGDFTQLMDSLNNKSSLGTFMKPIEDKLSIFSQEAIDFIKVVQENDLDSVRNFIENTTHLFRDACGVRHVDFIGYKPK
jgi:2-polyprenyl-3-methyl-5-hydroxy-6-metoxy-1,4-benzoquinol methylase